MTHEPHLWRTGSTHATSEGLVVYQRCPCGAHRVMLVESVIGRKSADAGVVTLHATAASGGALDV